MKRKKHWMESLNEPAKMFAIQHTMTNNCSCCTNDRSIVKQRAAAAAVALCINTCQVYNASYTGSIILGISGPRGPRLCNKKEAKKKDTK